MTTKPNDGGPAFPTTQENGANCGEPGMTNITIPLEVANAASEALGNFVSDHGWSDSDMQAMDNLDSYIARHKAIRAELAKPEQEETFIPNWANYRQGVADGKAGSPKWHDAPTEPGLWVLDDGTALVLESGTLPKAFDGLRWYGPIPQDDKVEGSAA